MSTIDQLKKKSPWFHFSIDDVFDSLIEVTDQNIPLFEHPYFSLLREMHTKYGITVGLHLFFQKKINGKLRTLSEVRDLKKEIVADGSWLFFGAHALDYDTPPYDQSPEDQMAVFDRIYKEIDRFAGKNTYAEWIRLHFYSESYELADYFAGKGVKALFSTDKKVGSHRMPQSIKDALSEAGYASYEGMNFIRTNFRVENFADDGLSEDEMKDLFKKVVSRYGYIIIYVHEYEFIREDVCEALRTSFKALNDLSIVSLKKV